ncbi:MAG: hypothetical protein ABEK01_00535 [Candidatus Nanohaloarchaea archaeon]
MAEQLLEQREEGKKREKLEQEEEEQEKLEIESELLEDGSIDVEVIRTTLTAKKEVFREDGEEKKVLTFDEDEESRSHRISSAEDRYPVERFTAWDRLEEMEVPEEDPAVEQSPAIFALRRMPAPGVEEFEIPEPPAVPEPEPRQEHLSVEEVSVPDTPAGPGVRNSYTERHEVYVDEEQVREDLGESDAVRGDSVREQRSRALPEPELGDGNELPEPGPVVETELPEPGTDPGSVLPAAGEVLEVDVDQGEDYLDSLYSLLREEDGLESTSERGGLVFASYDSDESERGIHQRLLYRVEEDALEGEAGTVSQVVEYLSSEGLLEAEVLSEEFYSDEPFEVNGEMMEPGRYEMEMVDVEGMDRSMTEFSVGYSDPDLAEDSAGAVEVRPGQVVEFTEAEVYSGHQAS